MVTANTPKVDNDLEDLLSSSKRIIESSTAWRNRKGEVDRGRSDKTRRKSDNKMGSQVVFHPHVCQGDFPLSYSSFAGVT